MSSSENNNFYSKQIQNTRNCGQFGFIGSGQSLPFPLHQQGNRNNTRNVKDRFRFRKMFTNGNGALLHPNSFSVNQCQQLSVINENICTSSDYRRKKKLRNSLSLPFLTAHLWCWWPVLVLVLTTIALDYVDAHQTLSSSHKDNYNYHPKEEFSNYVIINPKVHHGRHKRALTNTLENESGLHTDYITLSYKHNGQNVVVDLKLNEDLIPDNHFLRYQKPNGGIVVQNLTKVDVDLCHYQGTIRGSPDSYVAISTCNGINGIVFDKDDTYYLYAGKDGKIHDNHYLLKHNDILKNATCGFRDDKNHLNYTHNLSIPFEYNRILRYKRSTPDNVIRGPYNANKYSSFVELVMVIDNKVYKAFGENMKKVHNHCKDIANIVNALYVPLNIFIALVGVVVWNEANEIDLPSDGDATLKNFLHYRRKVLVKDHPNDNAQLLTKEQFAGGVVGKALKGPICTYEYSGGVSMEHSPIVAVVATTVAHEMGHNFGMEHDTSDCKCIDDKCIMSASSTSVVPRHWSSCSIDQLNVAFSHGMNYCLRNRPTKLFDSPQCGNGFVEAGEQCDCGLPEFCENTCCDPNTCMLHANASCATGECCDLTTCRPHSPGTKCRSADGECDLPEFCTGESEYCPADVYKRDTELCDNGNAFCYQGSCRSRSNQCKILWGPSGESSDHCYEKNIGGSRHGNCGYDRISSKFIQCLHEDIYCGMLHCRHLNERLEFGMESVAVLSHSFMSHEGNIIPCRTAIVDLGLDSTDPGLTPNGAKCGEGKMCVNQKCMSVENLQAQGRGVTCAEDCNGQGICNSKGHCHCFEGFGPPYCNSPGPGGSEDSGPATNPNVRLGFTRAMYIFFLGVVPVVSLLLFFTYYWRQNRPLNIRKASNVSKPTIKTSSSRGSTSPPGGPPTSTPSSTDDMNSALLKSPSESDTSLLNNNMFGKFKGFTLRPLPSATGVTNLGGANVAFVHPVSKVSEDSLMANGVPVRLAPPVPKPPTTDNKSTMKQNGTLPHLKNLVKTENMAPALPPPNPGFNARPIISNPVLETSTCTAKELISPLKSTQSFAAPTRPAPPPLIPVHMSGKSETLPKAIVPERKPKEGTVKKIASFLKKDEKSDSSFLHPAKMKPVIDREKLKNIEISAPIPVVDQCSDSEQLDNRQQVSRTQSMRDPSVSEKKANIQSFGSMRQPSGANRPKSIVGCRPKSPPPRPPAPPLIINLKIPGVPGYQNPPEPKKNPQALTQNEYDDCEAVETSLSRISERNSPTGSDNIYSVIEERSQEDSGTTISLPSTNVIPAESGDGMGLLGEIVNEIEKRNVDSIYSASTLKKKKPTDNNTVYANTSEVSDYSDGDYYRSNGSTTSSGYLRPSAINTPVARVAPTKPDQVVSSKAVNNSLSSFKPKTTQPANVNLPSKLKLKDEQKPVNGITNKATATNPSSNNNPKNSNTRTKLPPNSNLNKNNTDTVRKRSPSPGGALSKPSATMKGKTTKSSPNVTRKGSASDAQNNTSVKNNKSNDVNNSQAQKPKPLSLKPALGNKSGAGNSIDNVKFVRQNSNSTNNPARRTKSIDQDTDSNLTNKTDTSEKLIGNKFSNGRVNSSNSNNSNSSSNSKILNAAARPAPGKLSNVASLQQKFENNPINKTNNFSLSNNAASSLKK